MDQKVRTVTMAEWGPRLPHGIPVGGALHREVGCKEWTFEEEEQLGELREKNKDINMGHWVAMVLSTLLTKLGHNQDFQGTSMTERRIAISNLTMPDVFFCYIWLRRETIGKDLPLMVTCLGCNHEFKYIADLDTLEVRVVDEEKDALWEYKFQKPFEIRGKEVSRALVGPTTWGSLEAMGDRVRNMNTAIAKKGIIHGAIREYAELGKVPLAANEINKMRKSDIEGLANDINNRAIGPDMLVEGSCPKCGKTFKNPLDWSSDSFFATSSP